MSKILKIDFFSDTMEIFKVTISLTSALKLKDQGDLGSKFINIVSSI